ncbi:MAG: HAMP domain-containing protein [Deltaproteobacteria bacterium]|nr:HAMP domain-containing protein [Deltaproteobacteria bacterium]
MRSLFVKIFFSFVAIIFLSITIGAIFTYYNKPEGIPHSLKNFAGAAIHQYTNHAVQALRTGGDEALQQYIEDLHAKSGIRLFFLFEAQHSTNLPPQIRKAMRRAIRRGELVRSKRMDRPNIAIPLGPSFRPIIAASVQLPPFNPVDHPRPLFLNPRFMAPKLLSLLIIASLICYLLTRSLTAPIRQLRTATQTFAAGDLTTRVDTSTAGSSEINQLGDDFNSMAEQIEDLVVSQQRLQRDISHELRSPLARLNIALELARQRSEDKATAELDRIELESERLNKMIGQLLSLNQIDSQPIDLFTELDLSQLLTKLVADANFEAQDKQVHVVIDQPASLRVKGSNELLGRAIENIIRNAIHYSPEGGEVAIRVLSQENSGTVIQICDQGEGVPEQQLEKIFDPFFRVAAARDRRSGGTGIGLAISQRAIKRHNGTISATNRPSGGLEVSITLASF